VALFVVLVVVFSAILVISPSGWCSKPVYRT
jgi:hypothetical protein